MNGASTTAPVMRVDDLHMQFKRRRSMTERLSGQPARIVHALNGVSFTVARGETLGIVGESGCGKSTLARCLVRLNTPTVGTISYDGKDVLTLAGAARRDYHRRVQMVFQDPYGSLNPRMTVRQALTEAIRFHGLRAGNAVAERVCELLGLVRLPPSIVEPLIALSIAYVAVENLFTSELSPWRGALVFLFGLLHGLGFAGVLGELGVPRGQFAAALVSFNVGVELGQLSVISLAMLAVGWWRAGRSEVYRRWVVVPVSLAIAIVGLYWTVVRAMA